MAYKALSIYQYSQEIIKDGFNSWKIHFMNFVDDFRRTPSYKLVEAPPDTKLDIKLYTLASSIVIYLCREQNIQIPEWARLCPSLWPPWFVAEIENLKPLALIESPGAFRVKNIFVLKNFLDRV